jgi:Glyoxalase/Bleomycin resistance protein/Dioxygenase superfamily
MVQGFIMANCTLLNDIWNSGDFTKGVDQLAYKFRTSHGLPPLYQLGLVVKSVEESSAQLETQGIGPFFIMDGPAKMWRERGEERHFRGKMGLAFYRGVQLELLEPGEGSDFYRQSLDPSGGLTIQHLGFWVSDIEAWSNRLIASGSPVWIRGKLKSGPLTVDFVYQDTLAQAGFVMEFLCWKFLNVPFKLPAWVAHGIGRLEKITGKRSLST